MENFKFSSGITVSPGMEEIPSLNMPVRRLKVTILPLDLPCSGPVTHSVEILTTGKSLKAVIDLSKLSRPFGITFLCIVYVPVFSVLHLCLRGADIIEMISNLGIDRRP